MNERKEVCAEEIRALHDLPDIVLEKIFLYLSYDEIAKKRQVCQRFNRICGKLLTSGFLKAEKYHSRCMKSIKSQLPRRESERRNHPLSKHCDILSGIETRMSMLSMTFMKFISNGMCCFIPGKVIDEIFRILRYMESYGIDAPPPRTLDTLQELRDISSMAMEHFEEKIVPILKSRLECQNYPNYPLAGPSRRIENFQRQFMTIRNHEKYNMDILAKMDERLKKSNIRIAKQARMLQEQNAKLIAQDAQINELKQHLEEWDHKLRELEAKVNRVNDDNALLLEHSEETVVSNDSGCKRKCETVCSGSYSNEDNLPVKKQKVVSTVEEVGE
ncbi:F-box only protein 28 [Schistocerca cancellata]|uniref:F-box only protein 28 n=1 Tax=Schistocerca cancellata TaxID=274614 RepID=UPI0021182EDE|nr:F-box only protein 28 [Schistocerca cancellata]